MSLNLHFRALQVVAEFGKPGGIGELLQAKLEERKRDTVNWVKQESYHLNMYIVMSDVFSAGLFWREFSWNHILVV